MNIVCVYSQTDYVDAEKPLFDPQAIPFGISYVATSLKKAGHNIDLLVATPRSPLRKLVKKAISESTPRLVCLTSISSQIGLIDRLGKYLKEEDPSIFIVLGGHHASLNPEEAIAFDWADAICIGEGEIAVVELARQLEAGLTPTQIPNLWIKDRKSGDVERNPTGPFQEDLDGLPFIDRDMWRPWIAGPSVRHSLLVGRGCPNKCTYCSNHVMARLSKGRYVRFRSPANIIAEIQELLCSFPETTDVYLELESLGNSLSYAHRLLAELAEFNLNLPRPLNFWTNLAITGQVRGNRELVKAFKKANFKKINLGLESGSERIRSEVLRRPRYTNPEIISFCQMAHEESLPIMLYVLIGLPGETPQDFSETVEVVRACRPEQTALSVFHPYPGTHLHKVCEEQGLFYQKSFNLMKERVATVLNLPDFPRWRVRLEYFLFPYKVYKGRLPRFKVMARTLRNAITAWPRLHSFYWKLSAAVRHFI